MGFLESFFAVGEKVGLLFLLMSLGFVCQRIKWITEEVNRGMTNIVMYIVTPCVIINAFSGTLYEREELLQVLRNMGILGLACSLAHLVMIFTAIGLFRMKDEGRRRVMRFAVVFSNAGFVALPLAQTLIDGDGGHEGVLYAAVYMAVFNLFAWTWGVSEFRGEKGVLDLKKILFSPGVVGVVIGLFFLSSPLYITVGETAGLRLPGILADAIEIIAALNIPLPMLMVGYYLGKSDLVAALKDKWVHLCILLRLILFPLAALGIMYACGMRGNILVVGVLGLSAPVGATVTMFSTRFGRNAELSVRLVSLSTVLSMITMPFIIGLTQAVA